MRKEMGKSDITSFLPFALSQISMRNLVASQGVAALSSSEDSSAYPACVYKHTQRQTI